MFESTGQFEAQGRRSVGKAIRQASIEPENVRSAPKEPEVEWTGVVYGFSGYAKMNREIALRLAHSMRVAIVSAIEQQGNEPYTKARVDVHRRVAVSSEAPAVRCFGPRVEPKRRSNVIYTMMETEAVHRAMIGLMNEHYTECWTPTYWNASVFKRSGLRIPIHVMPLGVDPLVYRPGRKQALPEATLLTTERAGERERPEGFLFVSLFLPSFRKGADLLLPVFEETFADDPTVGLVLAVTHGVGGKDLDLRPEYRSRVWLLEGERTELELADLYRGCDAYVSASRGEGWNLPACEAAACGLPVIAGRHSAHQDYLDDENAWLFAHEGFEPWEGAETVSTWYRGMPFPVYGPGTRAHFGCTLKTVRLGGGKVKARQEALTKLVREDYTWDRASANVFERLMELQP